MNSENLNAIEQRLKCVYNVVNRESELFFGIDYDRLPKRRRMDPEIQPKPHRSSGYGELTLQGFDKLLTRMRELSIEREDASLDSRSGFLDIGSGFGKCVFHASLAGTFALCCGMEIVELRHEKALASFEKIKQLLDAVDWTRTEFLNQDVTALESIPKKFTHLYCFDRVFDDETRRNLARVYARSDFKILVCCTSPKKWRALGHEPALLGKVPKVGTTGAEHYTFYFYSKFPRQ